jgi:ATP phosphoribosyltransferase regulatory subunit HisZ
VDVLEGLAGPLQQAGAGMRTLLGLLEPRTAQRVIFDFGLLDNLGYYTGPIFQVYDPAYGVPLGNGGRYDDLLGDFGRSLPAVGFALDVERVHIALRAQERSRV